MIADEFLQEQVAESKANRETTPFLRRFVLRIVDQSLRDIFGDNYSIRCLQSSIAIQTLLSEFGIGSRVFSGAVCLSRATKGDPFQLGWAGFWGDDRHAWVATDFVEFVDLTISQVHLHPASSHDTDEAIPAIWWHPADIWPPIIKYLPEGEAQPDLPPDEANELERLITRLHEVKEQVMRTCDPKDSLFEPILYGPKHLQEMVAAGYPWLVKSLQIQRQGIPMPDWVINRDREMLEQYQNRS
jgi:hypothetical protein